MAALPAGGAAQDDRLPGDDLRDGVADLLGIGVHEPGHLAFPGRHVGRGNVALGSDDREDLGGVAPRETLELALGEPVGVAAHAALGAAERQAEQGALECHPHRERGALAHRHGRRVAHAALGRPQCERVLHPVAGERFDRAVVAADGEVDGERAPRLQQPRTDLGLQREAVGGLVELAHRGLPQLRAPFPAGRDQSLLAVQDVVPTAPTTALDLDLHRHPSMDFTPAQGTVQP